MKRTESTQTDRSTSPAMIAWHVSEGTTKHYWTRIGAAWHHDNGEGLTLQLDLLPATGGRIVLRNRREEEPAQ